MSALPPRRRGPPRSPEPPRAPPAHPARSRGGLHLGHLVPIMFTAWLQRADVNVPRTVGHGASVGAAQAGTAGAVAAWKPNLRRPNFAGGLPRTSNRGSLALSHGSKSPVNLVRAARSCSGGLAIKIVFTYRFLAHLWGGSLEIARACGMGTV